MTSAEHNPHMWQAIGHQPQVERLRRMVKREQLPLAMLITGPAQVGRRALATQFAAAALCPNANDANPCQVCSTCLQIAAGSHPDVETWSIERQEIETGGSKAGVLTIETVRRIAASTAMRPFVGNRRFMIIEDAETLWDAAQQALLKTLEDLPAFATMILIATNAGAMLDTVRSRCTEIALQLVPTSEIAAQLTGPESSVIAAMAAGRPGWAIRASTDADWLATEIATIDALESWILMPRTDRLVEAYVRGDQFARNRRQTIDQLDRIQLIWRDAALAGAGLPEWTFDSDRAARLTDRSSNDLRDWHRALTATRQCIQDLIGNIRPRLAMQSMVNQWPNLF